MTLTIALLNHEQRDEVIAETEGFTCRGARHTKDPTVETGDNYLKGGFWADLDEAGITRTWVAILDGRIVGYIALAADAVTLTKGERREAELEGVQFSRYGCTQIAMVAVLADCQAQPDLHIGRALIEHAMLVGRRSGSDIGARFLAADVNPPAQGFYERCGFTNLGAEAHEKARARGLLPMVLDLHPRL